MKISTITVRLPNEITAWLDSLVKSGIYKSRSEAIREFLRDFLNEQPADKTSGGGNISGNNDNNKRGGIV